MCRNVSNVYIDTTYLHDMWKERRGARLTTEVPNYAME